MASLCTPFWCTRGPAVKRISGLDYSKGLLARPIRTRRSGATIPFGQHALRRAAAGAEERLPPPLLGRRGPLPPVQTRQSRLLPEGGEKGTIAAALRRRIHGPSRTIVMRGCPGGREGGKAHLGKQDRPTGALRHTGSALGHLTRPFGELPIVGARQIGQGVVAIEPRVVERVPEPDP